MGAFSPGPCIRDYLPTRLPLQSVHQSLFKALIGAKQSVRTKRMNVESEPVSADATQFENLSPDTVIDCIESLGFHCDGRLLALNSYENRVYRIGIEEDQPIVAKFYRPQRWSRAAILEEHKYAAELADADVPVVSPLVLNNETLFERDGYQLAVYALPGGRIPEMDNPAQLQIIGRFIAKLHLVGENGRFNDRGSIDMQTLGLSPARRLLENHRLPPELEPAYSSLIEDLSQKIGAAFNTSESQSIRLHGDFHPGNILWRDDTPHIVDLDDCRNGPAVQDLWLFLSGDKNYQLARLNDLLDGYRMFRPFNQGELRLVEALRTLRIIHYAAWLDQRRDEQAFRQAFPWLGGARFWDDHLLHLKEQSAALDEPPLQLQQYH